MTVIDGAPAPATPPSRSTDWPATYAELDARRADLDAPGLDRLARAAWLLGLDDECERAWEAAHRAFLAAGDGAAAVRCLFWLGFTLGQQDRGVRARAWMARLVELCARLRETSPSADVDAIDAMCACVRMEAAGRLEASAESARRAIECARSAGDDDVETLSRMLLGRSLVRSGRIEDGFACMDLVMLAIRTGRVGDVVSGPAYCAVIASCLDRMDVERAHDWTEALSGWCDAQHGLVPFRGDCSVNRAAVLATAGRWAEAQAMLEDVVAAERRAEALENALYLLGELHRLSGRAVEAADAYRRAALLGRDVQPGAALLARATESEAGRAGIRRALESAPFPGRRVALLAALVDLSIDAADLEGAEGAAAELRALATAIATDHVVAIADRALAAVRLAHGETELAVPLLRRAHDVWRRLDAPYEAALTRVLMGRAARALGDSPGAALEFAAARAAFARLGAAPDARRVEALLASEAAPSPAGPATPLSRRELEVLRLVAAGRSNRLIARDLVLSERTVARHVGNILGKLGLANRSAATAYAYEHGLVISADAGGAPRS